jgi:hypothetical protein
MCVYTYTYVYVHVQVYVHVYVCQARFLYVYQPKQHISKQIEFSNRHKDFLAFY